MDFLGQEKTCRPTNEGLFLLKKLRNDWKYEKLQLSVSLGI
jgi:hypothetical protein